MNSALLISASGELNKNFLESLEEYVTQIKTHGSPGLVKAS